MDLVEIFADEAGETHFRKTDIALDLHDFAPPSRPIQISSEIDSTTSLFLTAPPGWDEEFHPTPRKQLSVMLSGSATVTTTDGETREILPGSFFLLNDQDSKGHLTRVTGDDEASFLLIGVS